MKKILAIIIFLYCATLSASSQDNQVLSVLKSLNMENIATAQRGDTITAAFETSVYRGSYNAIGIAIRSLITLEQPRTLQLVILNEDIPQICITLPQKLIEQYQGGSASLEDVYRSMAISAAVDDAMRNLKGEKKEQSTFGKVDIVLYPGVTLLNNIKTKLYRASLNIEPAIEMQLWKGGSVRLQVSLPIINNDGDGKWAYIHPGYLTIRQELRLNNHWRGYITAGNFSNDRMGVNMGVSYNTCDGRLTLDAVGGLTGLAALYGSKWKLSKWERFSGSIGASYYIPPLKSLIKVEGVRYTFGDYGVRGTFSRYFGEYIVGLYGMYTDGYKNAGFSFSIPLPGSVRKRHAVRVMLPEYFAFSYDMRSGNEYAAAGLGESYSIEPASVRNSRFWQPDYIRYYLIQTNKKIKK